MVLPLGLLNGSRKSAVLVEVKNGETFNGTLLNCDVWMNLHLTENGDRFWKLPEAFIRGSTIKYVRLPEEVMDNAKEVNRRQQQQRRNTSRGGRNNGGDRSGRGRGRGGRGGGSSGNQSQRRQ